MIYNRRLGNTKKSKLALGSIGSESGLSSLPNLSVNMILRVQLINLERLSSTREKKIKMTIEYLFNWFILYGKAGQFGITKFCSSAAFQTFSRFDRQEE